MAVRPAEGLSLKRKQPAGIGTVAVVKIEIFRKNAKSGIREQELTNYIITMWYMVPIRWPAPQSRREA